MRRYLTKKVLLVDRNLDRYLPRKSANPRVIHEAIRYSVFSGGKRLRPILALEAARACGGSLADAMPAACGLELIHAYSLIHDDLPSMDNDNYRRGKPTAHRKFGEAIAILAGDALLTMSFNLFSRIKDPGIQRRVVREVSDAIGSLGMIGGQVMDITVKRKNLSTLKYIHARKTAALIAVSARTGAMVAGADRAREKALSDFGKFLGLSFQIIDDLLDREDYFKFFGERKGRRQAEQFADRAKAALKVFGGRAGTLRAIASCMVTRKK